MVNPFEETMMDGKNVPQRTARQTRGPTGMGFAPPASNVSNVSNVVRPPHLRHRMSNIERQMDTYGWGRAGDTPIQSGGAYGEFGSLPQQDRLYSGRNPFIQPIQTGGRRGEFGGIFSGRNAGPATDMMSDYYGGQSSWADQLQSAIGGEGIVTPAQYTDDDKAIQRGLWKQANRNVNPEGITPLPEIVKEWERLQEEYWRLKSQGYRPGE